MITSIKIDRLSYDGKGIGYIDGKVAFVCGALPGEEVSVKVINDKKSFYECELVDVITRSDKRIESACPYFNLCGGCAYMHVGHNDECEMKVSALEDILRRKAGVEIDIKKTTSDKDVCYRNKLSLKVKNFEFGFYREETHEFVKIDDCLLASDAIRSVFKLKDYLRFREGTLLIRSNFNDELIIKIDTEYDADIDVLKIKENVKLVGIILNNKVIYGEDFFIEKVHNYFYKVNVNSFFQVNLDILSKVIDILRENSYGALADLYCGVGTLGIPLKKDKLYGIEIVKEAVIDAIYNAKINKQDNKYMLGSAEVISKINDKIDTIIIDPPRAGLNKKTLEFLINYKSRNLIYMSCNPFTLARDLSILKDIYDVEDVYYLDMFPRTKHMECLCLLNLK